MFGFINRRTPKLTLLSSHSKWLSSNLLLSQIYTLTDKTKTFFFWEPLTNREREREIEIISVDSAIDASSSSALNCLSTCPITRQLTKLNSLFSLSRFLGFSEIERSESNDLNRVEVDQVGRFCFPLKLNSVKSGLSLNLPFMDLIQGFGARSGVGPVTGMESLNFSDEIRQLVTMHPENTGGSFTALLEMPVTQAIELLHFSDSSSSQANITGDITPPTLNPFGTLTFPSNPLLLDRAARFSVIATEQNGIISGETANSLASNSGPDRVKAEPTETDSIVENQNSPQNQNNSSGKRKEREKKVKRSMKKTKSSNDANKLPYVHVRARRGQATDNHSLAERARREKINARMKLLQELVPGCDKIQGTALVLDEIINHVQSLQRQVEMLSMRLAAVNPRIDFNLDSILASENGSLMDGHGSFNGESYHQLQQWPFDGYHQPEWGREEDHHEANFAMGLTTLHPNQVKMEL